MAFHLLLQRTYEFLRNGKICVILVQADFGCAVDRVGFHTIDSQPSGIKFGGNPFVEGIVHGKRQ